MNAPRTAYLRLRASIFGVTTPMRESTVKSSGSSKTRPNASVNFKMKPTWFSSVIIGCSVSRA